MKRDDRIAALGITLFIGGVIGMTQLLAPVHEFFHTAVAGAQGSDARITGWATAEIVFPTGESIMAGWALTFSWGLVIAVVFSLIGRFSKAQIFTGGAGLGYAIVTWLRAFASKDFNATMKEYISQLLGPDYKSILPEVWDEVQQAIFVRWAGVGGTFLLITIALVVFFVAKPKKT